MPALSTQAAIQLVSNQCSSSVYPTLTEEQIMQILESTRKYTVWAASNAYNFGDIVQPDTVNGHLYSCIKPGTSGTTEPIWALYTTADDRPGLTRPYWDSWGWIDAMPGSENSDGTVLWLEYGFDDGRGPYDLRLATYLGWMQKAGIASADYMLTVDGDTYQRCQVADECRKNATIWTPTGVF